MKRSTFDTLLSFLLGFAWALLLFGGWVLFDFLLFLGFPVAFLLTAVFVFICLLIILMLEGLHLYKERCDNLDEQTRLLRRIAGLLEREK